MCGIAGFYCLGEYHPSKQTLSFILENLQSRGTDATGAATIVNGQLHYIKAPVKASYFVKQQKWLDFPVGKSMILHARAQTKGDAKDNNNNHPLVYGDYAIVHNGVIHNDVEVKEKLKAQFSGTVDSGAILACFISSPSLENGVEVVETELNGSYTVAALNSNEPDKLCLIIHRMPLVVAYSKEDRIIYFASTKEILKFLGTEYIHGIPFESDHVRYYTAPEDTAMLITGDTTKSWNITPKTWAPAQNYFGYRRSFPAQNIMDDEYVGWCRKCHRVVYKSDYAIVDITHCPFCSKILTL